jgi:protein TonB
MKKGLLIILSILLAISVHAQSPKNQNAATYSDGVNESEPEFPGGNEAFMKFIAKNLKYPKGEVEAQGKVFINFIVQKDGSTTNFRVVKSLHPALDREALNVLRKMPKWKPGMQLGKPVKCGYTVPLMFAIKED